MRGQGRAAAPQSHKNLGKIRVHPARRAEVPRPPRPAMPSVPTAPCRCATHQLRPEPLQSRLQGGKATNATRLPLPGARGALLCPGGAPALPPHPRLPLQVRGTARLQLQLGRQRLQALQVLLLPGGLLLAQFLEFQLAESHGGTKPQTRADFCALNASPRVNEAPALPATTHPLRPQLRPVPGYLSTPRGQIRWAGISLSRGVFLACCVGIFFLFCFIIFFLFFSFLTSLSPPGRSLPVPGRGRHRARRSGNDLMMI